MPGGGGSARSGGGSAYSAEGGGGKNHDYLAALRKTLEFYDAQRAGEISEKYSVSWRQSATLQDKFDDSDLSGGFFDGAGTMKYTFPLAFSMNMLSWAVLEFEEEFDYHIDRVKELLKHGVQWLSETNAAHSKVYAVVGNQTYEDEFWGRPSEMKATRLTDAISESKPGSDLAAEVAAAFAAASMIFADDADFKEMLISKASTLLQFAESNRGRYIDSIPRGMKYPSQRYEDELAWGNLWLFKATGQESYLENAKTLVAEHEFLQENPKIFNVDTKVAAVQLLLALQETKEETDFFAKIENFCNFYKDDVPKTTKGLAYPTEFAATGVAASSAYLCILAAQKLPKVKTGVSKVGWNGYGLRQINYLLGSSGRSYLVDYGQNYPTQPYHRGSSCPNRPIQCSEQYKTRDAPNMQILKGALVAGPDQDEFFKDKRLEVKYTSVSMDRNAVFTAALAAARSIKESDKTAPAAASSANTTFATTSIFILTVLFAYF